MGAVHLRGQTELSDDQRPITGNDLQSVEVGAELLGLLEEHVERQQVETLDLEVLRRRVVPVGDEELPIRRMGPRHELAQDVGHSVISVHADDVGRDLVGDAEGEHLGATSAHFERLVERSTAIGEHPSSDRPARRFVAPVAEVDSCDHAKAPLTGRRQQVSGRYGVDANSVQAECRDLVEVAFDLVGGGNPESVAPGAERTVRDAARHHPGSVHGEVLSRRGNTLHRLIHAEARHDSSAWYTLRLCA